jgi:hypothetical protein
MLILDRHEAHRQHLIVNLQGDPERIVRCHGRSLSSCRLVCKGLQAIGPGSAKKALLSGHEDCSAGVCPNSCSLAGDFGAVGQKDTEDDELGCTMQAAARAVNSKASCRPCRIRSESELKWGQTWGIGLQLAPGRRPHAPKKTFSATCQCTNAFTSFTRQCTRPLLCIDFTKLQLVASVWIDALGLMNRLTKATRHSARRSTHRPSPPCCERPLRTLRCYPVVHFPMAQPQAAHQPSRGIAKIVGGFRWGFVLPIRTCS